MLIRVTAVEVCDARDDDSSNAAGIKKIMNSILCNKIKTPHLLKGFYLFKKIFFFKEMEFRLQVLQAISAKAIIVPMFYVSF